MAVRAHHAPNFLLLNRAGNEMNGKDVDADLSRSHLVEQSPVFFSSGGNVNRRKRGREADSMAVVPEAQQQSVFSLQSPSILDLAHLQPRTPSLVSTGLHLAFDEQKYGQIKREQPDSVVSAFYLENLEAQISKENDEIEQFLIAQGEQLRQALVERQERHYRALLESAGRRLREKEAEFERAARCNADLEERLARFQTESMAWQAKALTEQAVAVSLHAQLQKAAAAAPPADANPGGESPAEDQESAHVDPYRSETLERPCRACRRRPATVVLLPCRQLCLCLECDLAAAAAAGGDSGYRCPACGCFRTGSLQVSFS